MKRCVRSTVFAVVMRSVVLLLMAVGSSSLGRADTTTYTYDALGRLRTVTVSGSGTYAEQSYDYDAAGNRTLAKSSRAPTVPPSISVPTTNTTGSYTISWSASTSGIVTAYELYEATNSSFSGQANVHSGVATSKVLSGKTTGTYYYRVRACNTSADCSDYRVGGNSIAVTVTPGQPPSLNYPSTSSTGSYTVSWGASTTGVVTAYELYESASTGWTNVYSGAATSKLISGKSDGAWTYRVRACNTPVDCSVYQVYPSGGSPITVRLTPSAPASINVPTSSTTGSYQVTWGSATGTVTNYELYEATNSSFTGEVLAVSWSYLFGGISGKGNGTYYYRVRACNTSTSCSGYAPGPNVITVTLPPAQPTTPLNLRKSPSTGTGNIYTILWDASSGPVSYYILEQSASGGPYSPFPQINHPTTSKSFNQSCGEYSYRVKACSSGGVCSGYSNTTTKRVCNN